MEKRTSITPNEVLSAYRAIQELSKVVLPYKEARAVMNAKRALSTEFETVLAMETAMSDEFGVKRRRNGQFDFPDNETAENFLQKYEAAMEERTAVKLPLVDLSKYTDAIRLSAASVEALEGIVNFQREDTDNG